MCSKTWLDFTFCAESIGFALSLILNMILLFLISEMPKKTFGSYKYLMFAFSVYGICYSSCNFWTKPNSHITDASFSVFNVRSSTGFSKSWGTVSLAVYCSCYGTMLSLLTVHFYYRFLSVTCPAKLSRFSMRKLPLWFILNLVNFTLWFILVYCVNGPSLMKDEILKYDFNKSYCLNLDEFSYVGPQYFYYDHTTGNTRIHIPSFIAAGSMFFVMTFTFGSLTYFGTKTYAYLKNLGVLSGNDCRELQNQLFRTLVVQTIIPTAFMYFPVGCLFLFPVFGLKSKVMENIVPFTVSIYPCFEPLVAVYFIKSFRKRIIGIITCQKYKKRVKVSNVATTY
ncbi:hypothetical protein CRE_13066 [Caenorhabditis remanei]|uniref:Serpentine receptor class r-10 n=1 Tax=Caenorhabditis remanei TaxID=31234 RepID=E3N7F3_CAERE|nr:hypothetical protein CRE_13066 [Caenorhabditis remanei]